MYLKICQLFEQMDTRELQYIVLQARKIKYEK